MKWVRHARVIEYALSVLAKLHMRNAKFRSNKNEVFYEWIGIGQAGFNETKH